MPAFSDSDSDPYLSTAYDCCSRLAQRYVPALTASVAKLPPAARPTMYAVVGFAALAYELTDPWRRPAGAALDRLREETDQALATGFSANPVLHALQQAARVCHLSQPMITAFLDALAVAPPPVWQMAPVRQLGSEASASSASSAAELLALLVLGVICAENQAVYNALCEPARCLGVAADKLAWLQGPAVGSPRTAVGYYPGWCASTLSPRQWATALADIVHDLEMARAALSLVPVRTRPGVLQLLRACEGQVRRLRQELEPLTEPAAGWLPTLRQELRLVVWWLFGW